MTTNTSAALRQTRKADFTLHALDLNTGLVDWADAVINEEDLALLDRQIASHWIFKDRDYAPRLQDLVACVRAVQAAGNVRDERNDNQLAARILQSRGLWDEQEPTGLWGRSRFLSRFLVAYGKLTYQSDVMKHRGWPVSESNGQSN
jgi:hypothetical protein